MTELQYLLTNAFKKGTFIDAIISNVRTKSEESYTKIHLRPVDIKDSYRIQCTYSYGTKVIHENLSVSDAVALVCERMEKYFKQASIFTISNDHHILSNKRCELSFSKKKPTKVLQELVHNSKKKYLLEEGVAHDFLVALDIMSPEGKVYKPKYAKFKQINKYLEILEDSIRSVNFDGTIRVVDFGCGKAYLTFAMYYYFVKILKKPVEIVGLDLKADVIANLTSLKTTLGYADLRFQQGDIKDFTWDKRPDIVVSLHACDTATDAAIAKAIQWESKVIMAVPCCQHELFQQVQQKEQNLFLKQGVLKERFSALATDAIRATLMEIVGYQTVVMEFIDMEHTPKNLMIRGVRTEQPKPEMFTEYRKYCSYWNVIPQLEKLLKPTLLSLNIQE